MSLFCAYSKIEATFTPFGQGPVLTENAIYHPRDMKTFIAPTSIIPSLGRVSYSFAMQESIMINVIDVEHLPVK